MMVDSDKLAEECLRLGADRAQVGSWPDFKRQEFIDEHKEIDLPSTKIAESMLDAFKPLFNAAEEVKASKACQDRIYTLTSKLFVQRDHATEGEWMQDYEDAETMIKEEADNGD